MPVDLAQLADLPDVGSRPFKQPEQAVQDMFEEEEEGEDDDNEMVGANWIRNRLTDRI